MTAIELSPDRVDRITGSRIPKILGLSPYGDADSVMREMVREHFGEPVEFTGNWATEHGQEFEDQAITLYENRFRVMVHGGGRFVRHPTIDWAGVTPDGLVGTDGLVETKCPPWRARYTRVDERPDYEAQIRFQIECTQREWGDLAVYKDDRDLPMEDRLFPSRVHYDEKWWPSVRPELERFIEQYVKVLGSAKLSAPYREPLRVDRQDAEWMDAEWDYADALATLNAAKAEVEARHARLVELSKGKTTRGRFYQVTHTTRAGNVNWKKFADTEAPDADPEKYRGRRTPVTSINPVGSKRKKTDSEGP